MYSHAYRIPALVDHTAGDVPIFESGAIMWWLASRDPEAKLFPKDAAKQADVMSWLMFQMVGLPHEILRVIFHDKYLQCCCVQCDLGCARDVGRCCVQGGVGPMQGQANHFLRYAFLASEIARI